MRKMVYSGIAVLLTACTLSMIFYIKNTNYVVQSQYEYDYLKQLNAEDEKYLGYIFDDYNKKVSINYVDKVYKAPVENVDNDIVSTMNSIDRFFPEMEVDDRTKLKDIFKKMGKEDIEKIKGVFDKKINYGDVILVINELKDKLTKNDFETFFSIVDKYKD